MGMIGMAFGLGFILGPAIGALLSSPSLNIQSWGLPGLNPFSTAAAMAETSKLLPRKSLIRLA